MWGSYGSAQAQSKTAPAARAAKDAGASNAAASAPRVADSQAPAALATQRARQSYREGVDAFNRSDFEAARIAFLQTLALKPDVPEVRRNLGLAQIYSGHYLEGARRVARVLHSPNAGSPQNRTRMLESLKKAEAHLERLTIEVDVDGALVEVDGEPLGMSPISYVWYVAPGHYDLRVSKSGFVAHRERRTSRAAKASHLRVALARQLKRGAAPPSSPSLSGPPMDVAPHGRPAVGGLIVGGVATVAGLLGGSYFLWDAWRLDERATARGKKIQLDTGNNCDVPYNETDVCENLRKITDKYILYGNVLAPTLFTVAGVAALGTLGYWLWPRKAPAAYEPEGASLRDVGIRFEKGGAKLHIEASF